MFVNAKDLQLLIFASGGIRGIVELETLHALEEALGAGCSLPIRAFFDLIVGTRLVAHAYCPYKTSTDHVRLGSTGGIIALAVGVKQWPIEKCINVFTSLCQSAFTEREFARVWGLEQMATLNHGSKWRTRPLHQALGQTLGYEKLFGGVKDRSPGYPVKVAVTSTSGTGQRPLVIANYSRGDNGADVEHYDFLRRHDPNDGLEVWEAAAATSASPGYFKEFYHERTKQVFLDGALYYNNPVHVAYREAKLIWPDVAESPPDLLLSIGTGVNHNILQQDFKKHPRVGQNPM